MEMAVALPQHLQLTVATGTMLTLLEIVLSATQLVRLVVEVWFLTVYLALVVQP